MNIDTYVTQIIAREGDTYTNDPSDKGGPTKYGITEATARKAGYMGDMRDLSETTARSIYTNVYWLQPKFDQLALIDETLAEKLLDIGVNRGQTVGIKYVQRGLNCLNYQGAPYADLIVDGALGGATFGALKAYYAQRGAAGKTMFYQLVQAFQAVDYVAISEQDKTQEKYTYGWLTQRAFGV